MLSTSYSQRQEMRRFRNRTLSGMDASSSGLVGLGRSGSALGHHHSLVPGGGGGGLGVGGPGAALDHFLQQRPSSATGLRSITPSFGGGTAGSGLGDKENGQNFVDFNPAGERGRGENSTELDRITYRTTRVCNNDNLYVSSIPFY